MPTFEYTASDGSVYQFDGDENSARMAFQGIGQQQAAPVSAGADFAKSIPTGLVKGLSAAQSAAGNAAMLEMGEIPDESTSSAETVKQYEKSLTGPLYQPQGFTGRVGQGMGEVMGNPASYVGPGGLLGKILAAAGAGLGSEALGELGKAVGGPGGEFAGRLAGGVAGGASTLAGAKGIGNVIEKAAPGLWKEETGALAAPGLGTGGNGPTIPTDPLAGFDPMAVTKLARQVQQSDMTPADWEARFAQLGPEGFLAEGSRNLMGGAAGIASDVGPGMNTLYRAFEQRGAQAEREARIDHALTDAMGPRVNIPEQTERMVADRKAAADPLYEQFRNTTIPMTPQLEALLPRLRDAGATAVAAKNMGIEGKPFGPTAETWDYMKQALDDEIGPAIRGGLDKKARIYTNLKNDLTSALDNHPDPNVAGVYAAARRAYAGPKSIQNALEEGQELFDRGTHPDQFAIDWQAKSDPEKQALLQGARASMADIMDQTNRGVTNAVSKIQARANQAKLRTMIGDDKTNQLVLAAEREAGFAGNRNTIGHGSDTALRQSGREEFRTPESPLTRNQIYMPAVSTQPWTAIPGALHNRYLNWFYPRMRQSAAQMYTTPMATPQGTPDAQELIRALLAHQIPQNPIAQGAGYAAAPSIINALRQMGPQ